MEFLEKHLLDHGLVSPSDFNLFRQATSVDDAVEQIMEFYRNYISYRWVRHELVIRLRRQLTAEALEALNRDFVDMLAAGRIEFTPPLPEEANQPDLAELPRLRLAPKRHELGRLRALIDAINRAPTQE